MDEGGSIYVCVELCGWSESVYVECGSGIKGVWNIGVVMWRLGGSVV